MNAALRKGVIGLGIASYAFLATGLSGQLHVHVAHAADRHCDHAGECSSRQLEAGFPSAGQFSASSDCPTCHQLTFGWRATIGHPQHPAVPLDGLFRTVAVLHLDPAIARAFAPIAPRAPPAA